MKVYLLYVDNGEEYEDNYVYLIGIYATKELAKKEKTNQKKKYRKSYYEHTFWIEEKTVIGGE